MVERCSLLVEERLGAHEDAGCAETALQGSRRRERSCQAITLVVVESLEGGHLTAGGLGHIGDATDPCFSVEEDGAASALAGGGTAVFG